MRKQRKVPGVVIDDRAREELIEEGEQITQMLQFGSVVPEREAEPYYLIAQNWFTRWQKYTGCFKVEDEDDDENDEVFPSKDKSNLVLGAFPGLVNERADLRSICAKDDDLTPDNDIYCNFQLKPGMKEGQDYQVVNQEMWDILCGRYGGRPIRRFSITVPTEEPTRPDYVVEIQLRKFRIVTYPKVKYFPQSIRKEVYVSRADTVKELIARICNSETYDQISDKVGYSLANSCRLWVMEGDTDF